MKTVEVYRLWENGKWDLTVVDIEEYPWTPEVIESRAVTKAWEQLEFFGGGRGDRGRCMRMGLWTPIYEVQCRAASDCENRAAQN